MFTPEILAEIKESLRGDFPALRVEPFRVTSQKTPNYNCIAWAAEDDHHWWEPIDFKYWPQGVVREFTLSAYIQAYATRGYIRAADGSVEPEHSKIAIYTSDGTSHGRPMHAARQVTINLWTSKLGRYVDIEHTLAGLEGASYGRVACYLKRRTP